MVALVFVAVRKRVLLFTYLSNVRLINSYAISYYLLGALMNKKGGVGTGVKKGGMYDIC